MTESPPNVVFICTDQQFAGAMSCAGNDDLDTPAMDRLAEGGVRFENAYCTDPVCTPSRASLFTGRMPHETGVTENGAPIPESFREEELGHLFADAGYDCAHGGKWHVPEIEMPPGHGFETIHGFDDTGLADACVEFIERDHDGPFLLSAHFDNPHNICEWARDQPLPWGDVPRVPTEECPTLPRNFAIPPFEPEEIRPAMADDRAAMGAMVDASPEEWRHYRHAYYRLVETVDREIGRILDGLEAAGLAEETVVVFTSDHGDGHGAHQISQKWWLYEEIVRVPLLIRYPGETRVGHVDDRLVSNGLDLLPTLCDYADIEPPEDLLGRSLRPLAGTGTAEAWRDAVVSQVFTADSDHNPIEGRMVRTDRYKYVVYARGREREQLFDLAADPGELVDLSADAAHREALAAHRRRLLEWCIETGDAFAEPNALPGVPSVPGYEAREVMAYLEAGSVPE